MTRILVVGAGGALGVETVRVLRERGLSVTATLRIHRPDTERILRELGAEIAYMDLQDPPSLKACLQSADGAIFIPILSTSKAAARLLSHSQGSVFFSSNNVSIDPGAKAYAALVEAEHETRAAAPSAVILRPTMIYGHAGDGNISRLMRLMKRARIAPLPGDGKALQQPVYYRDVARAAVDALFSDALQGCIRAVSGPDALTQRDLYRAIGKACGVKAAIVTIPTWPLARLLKLMESIGLRAPVSFDQIRRVGLDKTPRGEEPIITETTLAAGLRALNGEIDAPGSP